MTTLISRSPIPLFIAWLLFLGAGLPPVWAQEAVATILEEPTGQPAGDIIYLKDESGRPVPVHLNASLKEYLEWRDAQREKPEGQLPEYSVDRLTLTGIADDRLVHLEAVLTVRIRKKNCAVTVPLYFNEAVLNYIKHTGEGDFAFAGLKNNTGYEWKIAGEGTHEIHLKMSVRITRQLASSRMQLTLPPTAVGSLELEVGLRDAAFKTPARTAFEITPRGKTTAITLFGLTENLDLTWQAVPESRTARPILESRTEIQTRMTTSHVLVNAQQQISAVSGSFQQLEVRLPVDYQLESVEDDQDLIESYAEIEGRSGWYRLQLSSPTTGPIALDWTLSLPLPEPGASFKIDGFELGGDVRLQSGRLNISELPGYRLQERGRRALFRTDVLPASVPKFSRAFDFFRQPFSLILELQKIQPLYSLSPRLQLQVEREALTWIAELNLSVQRGSVSQLSLQWPGWREAGWRLLADEQSELIDGISVDDDDPSILHVRFLEPLSGENIQLSLEAVKDLTDREAAERVSVQLPRFPRRVVSGETELLVTSRPALEVTLLETGDLETLPDPIPNDASQTSDVVRRLRIPEFSQPQLALSVVPRERVVRVRTNVTAELAEDENTLSVRQSFQYEVRFDGIETLRFRVPSSILKSLTAVDENGSLLSVEPVEGTTEILTPVHIALPEKRTGPFLIQFQFELAPPGLVAGNSGKTPWSLPLIQPSEAVAERFVLQLDPVLSAQYEPGPEEWQRTEEFTFESLGDAVRQNIVLERRRTRVPDILLTVRQCLHVTLASEDGLIQTRSEYLLNGRFNSLTIRLPEHHQRVSLELNGRQIPRESYQLNDLTLVVAAPERLPADDVLEQRLTIIVSTEEAPLKGVGTLTCEAPELLQADSEPVQQALQTFWLVKLPYQQHLFFQPDGYTSHSLWQRQGFFWSRVPRKSIEELSDWVQIPAQDLQKLLTAGGNFYLFHGSGAGNRLVMGTMHRSVVVLAGAGLTLLISFMLLRLPATRNALTLLIIASLLAFAGIWYPTSVALLLQPAILGFCLACLATVLDHLFRRPQLPTVVTFEDPTGGSSQMVGLSETSTPLSQLELGLGSEDPTQMKYREVLEEPMSSHISSGE